MSHGKKRMDLKNIFNEVAKSQKDKNPHVFSHVFLECVHGCTQVYENPQN